jgi:magnesium transporter
MSVTIAPWRVTIMEVQPAGLPRAWNQEGLDLMNISRRQFDLNSPVLDHASIEEAVLRAGMTVKEGLASLRGKNLAERIIYFYVVDDSGRLVGVAPTRRFLASPPETTLDDIMIRNVHSISGTATLREAAEAFITHRFLAMPVVDTDRRFLGSVDITLFSEFNVHPDDREISPDEVFQLIGVHIARLGSVTSAFRERLPWLLCNIAGGLLCAIVAGLYESLLDAAVVLALFIPVVLALAESVSIQSMTLAIQGLGSSRTGPRWGALLNDLKREFRVATLLGLVCGTAVAVVCLLWKGDLAVASTILISITLSMITACLLGVAFPALVFLMGKNPKIAAGPIVLACADMATMLFYLNAAGLLLD